MELRSSILEFTHFPSPHTASTAEALLRSIITNFDIARKISAITTDIAREMGPAMEKMRQYLYAEGNEVHSDRHIRSVCHILNHPVKDSDCSFVDQVSKLRELLKRIRASPALREQFKHVQIALDTDSLREVPDLDIETRWNSMFLMVQACVTLKTVLEALCNKPEYASSLKHFLLNDEEWKTIEYVCSFLQNAFSYTRIASGWNYVTLSLLPMIHDALKDQCLKAITNHAESSIPHSIAKSAMKDMLLKLTKYKFVLWSSLATFAQTLDSRISNASVTDDKKDELRDILIDKYGLKVSTEEESVQDDPT